MRILLAHKFHKLTGGAEVFYFEVGRVLKANGHEVAYFSTLDDDTIETPYKKYFIKAPNFKSENSIEKLKSFLRIPYNFQAKKNFKKLIHDFKPDIVHAFGVITQISPSIFDVTKEMSIPLVVSLNDYKHICPNYKLYHHNQLCEDCKGGKFYKAVVNKCSHNSYTFSVASSLESYIHSWLNIYKKNIDLFLFASNFMAEKTEEFWGEGNFNWGKLQNPFKLPDRKIIIQKKNYGLYFGRLSDEKGIEHILNALSYNRKCPFKIVGDGPLMEKLKDIVKREKLNNVEFLGALWGDKLNEVLYHARYVVLPSVWHENFPYVILQSFAAGVPVLGSNLGGIPELLDNNRGIVFDTKEKDSLANSIRKINENSELQIQFSKKGREYIENNFGDKLLYSQIIDNYSKVLNKKIK